MPLKLIEELIKQIPNFIGLVVLAYVLWLINEQTNARLDVYFQYLLSCFQAQGIPTSPGVFIP